MASINGSQHMASLALRGLDRSSDVMRHAMEKLSSGKRINRSADDAAGMAITLVHKAQTMGLGASVKHASEAIGVVNTIENAIGTANNLLLRLRELSVQASSEIATKTERKFMQDEVNQINMAINRLATDTKYNNKKVLNGTYNSSIAIGKDGGEFINLNISPIDTSSIGSHELNSASEYSAANADHQNAIIATNALFHANADYEVKGANGAATISMDGGESARDLAQTFNLVTGKTGVSATAVTRLKIKGFVNSPDSNHFTFSLQGKTNSKSIVTASVENINNLTSLKDTINSVSSNTGIVANLVDNKNSITLTQKEGYNIIIGDFIAEADSGSPLTASLYIIEKNASGNLVETGSAQTLINGGNDSTGFVGQVTFSSSKAFSITPGHTHNHFNSSTNTVQSSFSSLDNIDLTTQLSASNSMAQIDSALAMISEMRSELGAKNVRFQSIVDNLTNLEMNTERHVDILEDADFGAETTKLAKSQVLQEASNAMIAQANNISKFMMSFLNMFK